MTGFTEKDCVGCERCGAFIPKAFVQFHKCMGSDKSKRPANVPLEQWIEMNRYRSLDTQFSKIMDDFGSAFPPINVSRTRVDELKMKRKEQENENLGKDDWSEDDWSEDKQIHEVQKIKKNTIGKLIKDHIWNFFLILSIIAIMLYFYRFR